MVNPILLIVVPLATAFFIPIFSLIWKGGSKYLALLAALFNIAVASELLVRVKNGPIHVTIAGYKAPIGIDLLAGHLGVVFALIISVTGFLVLIYSISYIKGGWFDRYYALFLLLLTGTTGMVLTNDIFNLFVFFEIVCISSYILVAYNQDSHGLEASIKYVILGSIGSTLFLIAIALIYMKMGTLNMADISDKIGGIDSASRMLIIVLLITGLGVEGAVFPLNSWLPDAHASAPSTISALLSGFVIEVALIVLVKLTYSVFHATSVLVFLAVLGVTTLLIGEFAAFRQENIKRALAYSSIGQIGLILFALSLNTEAGIRAGMFQIINHAASKSILFLASGYMIVKTGSYLYKDYRGIAKKMPVSAFLFAVGTLSLIGVPPFLGFFSKIQIIMAAAATGSVLNLWLIAAVLLGTIIEGIYFLKIVIVMFSGTGEELSFGGGAPFGAVLPIILLGLVVIAGFVFLPYLNTVNTSVAQEIVKHLSLAQLF
ncbi:MAG: hypothetical protein J7K04_06975 [Spirochaetales bacterium]|nr:hypothetical protein [Spirochaetales bacterium]